MTEAEFESLQPGDRVHFDKCLLRIGPRGGAKLTSESWRVNGRMRGKGYDRAIPLKFGMYEYGALGFCDRDNWHLESNCQVMAEYQDYMAARRAKG